jgi:hypothetical protein
MIRPTLFQKNLSVHMANANCRTRFDVSGAFCIGAMLWAFIITIGVLLVAWRMS